MIFEPYYAILTQMKKDREKNLITVDTVRHAAKLARLSLDDDAAFKFQAQLSRILEFVAQLEEVDTAGTLPTSHVLASMKNVFREDVPKLSISQEEALSNAPDRHDGFFKVPLVID